jgi:hypothetical protein
VGGGRRMRAALRVLIVDVGVIQSNRKILTLWKPMDLLKELPEILSSKRVFD